MKNDLNESMPSEQYDHSLMMSNRSRAISTASQADTFGVVLGTLGRQGSPNILKVAVIPQRKTRRVWRNHVHNVCGWRYNLTPTTAPSTNMDMLRTVAFLLGAAPTYSR